MFRKIAGALLAVLLLAACIFFYIRLRKAEEPVPNGLLAVPVDAAFIIECRQSHTLFQSLDGSSIIWQDLRTIPSFAQVRNVLHELDSLVSANEKMQGITEGNPLLISAHPTEDGLSFLCSFSIPANYTTETMTRFIASAYQVRARENGISSLNTAERKEICFFAVSKGILLLSTSESLVNKAVLQSKNTPGILQDRGFQTVWNTAKSSRFDLRFFLHFPQQAFWPKSFLSETLGTELNAQGSFAQWMALDASIKPQSILLNGFCSASPDSDYLALFHDQNAQPMDAVSVMPASTATFLHFGYSNFKDWFLAYDKKRSAPNKASLDSVNTRYETDMGAAFSAWIETETAVLLCESDPEANDSLPAAFVLLRSENPQHALKALDELTATVCHKDDVKNDTLCFGTHLIRRLPVQGLLPLLFGKPYAVTRNYYTSMGSYLLFANSPSSLIRYLKLTDSEHTLSKDIHYTKFSSNLASRSNVYLYTNLARSANIYPHFTSHSLGSVLRKQTDLLLRFDALAVQFSSKGDLFYCSSYLEENPLYKKEIGALWEARLDTVTHFRPLFLVNHTNNTLDVFVQDEAHKIYLLSNTGTILWTKKLTEKITSPVYQVDAFHNNKLQMLFNTRTQLFLIDRNGKDVEGFPVHIPSGACNAVSVMDYDHKNDYRILLVCSDKHIRNYTIKGKPVEGWKEPVLNDTTEAGIIHTLAGGKDLLLTADRSGEIYLFDRHGEIQNHFKDKLPAPLTEFSLNTGKDPAHTFLTASDTLGNIVRISLNGKTEHIPFKKFEAKPSFLYHDLNGDHNPEYVFLEGNQLSVFTQDKSLLFSYMFSDSTGLTPFYVPNTDGHGWIGVVSENTSELYLLNESGAQPQGFPLKGKLPFSIGDINHTNTLQLVSGEGKNIYVYTLP
ncbi:MAG TPA: DUF3352 domain-containing protein [Bacteroidia bacterium]|jgi:hypothetical protein|nr:DUF3352 domain-containing protein [Bacteroidia bacterium]